jgi:serine/threonine protein kinase/tetratricopeptide (TPR) repeat protein
MPKIMEREPVMPEAQQMVSILEPASDALPAGGVVGPYRLVDRLGAGGMGIVYRAHDPRLNRDVAIKLIRPDKLTEELSAAFLREARHASSLKHPGIVTIYDILTHGDLQCIVMEYIEGTPLKAAIPPGGVVVDEAKRLAVEIGHALAAAHRAGIVHRDLKPGNIMVTNDGRIKIVDFGLSAVQRTFNAWDETGTASCLPEFSGTIGYMAPENVRGEAVNLRSDIFSYAVVFHEILTGQLPFTAADQSALLWAMQREEPILPSVQRPGLGPIFDQVVSRGLAKDPRHRYQAVEEMVEAIIAAHAGSTRSLNGLASGPITEGRVRLLEPPKTGSEQTSIAVLPFTSVSPDPEDGYLAAGLALELVSALTGLPGLRIAPQLSSFRMLERVPDPIEASRELNVRYILTGSLRRIGERIRVHAELTDGVGETVCWSRNFDRPAVDLFSVQEEIARTIVKSLGGELIRVASQFAFQSPTDNLDAWGLLRKAYHMWNYQFSVENVLGAIELCRRAVALDPNYARAHANLGLYLIQTVVHSISADPVNDTAEALAAADRATRMAPQDVDVLASSAIVFIHCGHYERAVLNTRQAVRIAPYDLVSWGYLGFAHACAGGAAQLEEALRILTQLIADAPEHPSLPYWEQFLTIAALRLERYDIAVEHGRRAVELQPGFVHNLVLLSEALCRAGLEQEARETVASIALYNPAFTLAAFEKVALDCTRSPERTAQLCGQLRALSLLN